MTFDEWYQKYPISSPARGIARAAYEAGAREEAELKQAWKDKAISLRARVGALEEALVLAAIPLEAIKASVKWELSTDINAAVGTALIAIRREFLRGRYDEAYRNAHASELKISAAAGGVCECGHTKAEHGQPGCLYECCLGFRPALDALRAAPAPRVEAAAGVDPLPAGTLLACGHVMGDLRCGDRCPTPPSIAAPAPREPCCDLASRGTHRKGCTGEPRSKQLADALGREAPLTDAEIVALRHLLTWMLSDIGSEAGIEAMDACKTAARAAVAARKEPKP